MRDLNMEVAGQLHDLALVYSSPRGRMAYRRAAQAILHLERTVDRFAAEGTLRSIPYVGPATERVVLEYLRHGFSPTVERAITASPRGADLTAARALRRNFLSRSRVREILDADLGSAITRAEYRGDLQTHSNWSDGAATLEQLASAASERSHAWLGISDHSYGLKIARGMTMAHAERRRAQIAALNRRWAGAFRLFDAIEANVPPEGGVDMTPAEVASFEIVLAAPHSRLRKDEDQTGRMLATVRHPGVHILAHPRGRLFTRQGVIARWREVFEEAARNDVIVEIDGDPYRQDLDYDLARVALEAGCWFALDSDAHSGAQLAYSDYAIAHARLAGIPAARVVNTWPAERLLEWVKRKSRSATASRGGT